MDGQVVALEVELLLAGLAQRYGYDFRHYARPSITRRIGRVMQLQGLSTISELQSILLRDKDAAMRFVTFVAVTTTSMFRDADVYRSLRTEVIPLLRTYPFVRIWHAGCASGEEVYSLAVLLEEEGLYDRCRIYGTDLSDAALEQARRGIMPLHAMRGHTRAYHEAGGERDFSSYYTTDQDHAVIRQSLRRNLLFSQHNLVCDSAFNEFHLIVCRNVLLYFDEVLRDRVHDLFHSSLVKFGVLVLGKKESLRFTRVERRYRELHEGLRVYRRLG